MQILTSVEKRNTLLGGKGTAKYHCRSIADSKAAEAICSTAKIAHTFCKVSMSKSIVTKITDDKIIWCTNSKMLISKGTKIQNFYDF